MKIGRHHWLMMTLAFLAIGCSRDAGEPTAPPETGSEVLAYIQPLFKPVQWSAYDLTPTCEGGQLQSAYPLDATGKLILVGAYPCYPDTRQWQVYDLSSGQAVLVDQFDASDGFELASHSPVGSRVGFGGSGNTLVVYNDGFSTFTLPCERPDCNITDVWASSATDVWINASGAGVYYWDGQGFTLELADATLSGIWGFGGPKPTLMYAIGGRILKRDGKGTWSEVVEPGAYCLGGGLWLHSVAGVSPRDVWATGFSDCIMHFDGRSWSAVPIPDDAYSLGGIWPLNPGEVVLSGQGGQDPATGRLALWGSTDGGQTWSAFEDPAFVGLTSLEIRYFNLAGTQSSGIIAPGIGGVLAIGLPGNPTSTSIAHAPNWPIRAAMTEADVPIVYPQEK